MDLIPKEGYSLPKQRGGGASGWGQKHYADFRVHCRPSDGEQGSLVAVNDGGAES